MTYEATGMGNDISRWCRRLVDLTSNKRQALRAVMLGFESVGVPSHGKFPFVGITRQQPFAGAVVVQDVVQSRPVQNRSISAA